MQVLHHNPVRRLPSGQALERYTTTPYFFLIAVAGLVSTIESFPHRRHRETALPAVSSVTGLAKGGSKQSIDLLVAKQHKRTKSFARCVISVSEWGEWAGE